MKHTGTIVSQQYVKSFTWMDIEFNEYLIEFKEYNGKHTILRRSIHEQALIGAYILFDYNSDISKVTKYKVLTYKTLEQIKNEQ